MNRQHSVWGAVFLFFGSEDVDQAEFKNQHLIWADQIAVALVAVCQGGRDKYDPLGALGHFFERLSKPWNHLIDGDFGRDSFVTG